MIQQSLNKEAYNYVMQYEDKIEHITSPLLGLGIQNFFI